MSRDDRQRWESRYADPQDGLLQGPHDLLKQYAPPAAPGCRALELACGLGNDARWLAAQGYTVDALDISLTALRAARAALLRDGRRSVNFIVADLDRFPLPDYPYDLVYVFRFLDRRLFPAIRDRVRPGGMVIYETLNVRFLEEHDPTDPAFMLDIGELPTHFPGWTVLEAGDGERMSRFVGRKEV